MTTQDKPVAQHLEIRPQVTLVGEQEPKKRTEFQDVQLKSNLDNLTIWKAIKVFRKTTMICAVAGFVASTDGKRVSSDMAVLATHEPRTRCSGFDAELG